MAYNKDTGMYEGYIYKIYNDVNDKVYIGQTRTTIESRWSNHINTAEKEYRTSVLYKAIKKHGIQNFHIQEILKVQNESKDILILELNELEKMYIKKYQTLTVQNGYNIENGGVVKENRYKKVHKYSLDGELVCTYESIQEASKCMNCNNQGIIDVCKGRKQHFKGFVWRYENDSFYKYCVDFPLDNNVDSAIQHKFSYKKVNCYTKDNNYICTYDSLEDARKAVGLKNSYNITNVCQKRRNYAGGYKWFYSDDSEQPDKSKIIS